MSSLRESPTRLVTQLSIPAINEGDECGLAEGVNLPAMVHTERVPKKPFQDLHMPHLHLPQLGSVGRDGFVVLDPPAPQDFHLPRRHKPPKNLGFPLARPPTQPALEEARL